MTGATEAFGEAKRAGDPPACGQGGCRDKGGQRCVRKAHGWGEGSRGKCFGCQRLLGRVWVTVQQQTPNKPVTETLCHSVPGATQTRANKQPGQGWNSASPGSSPAATQEVTQRSRPAAKQTAKCCCGNFQSGDCCRNKHYICK